MEFWRGFNYVVDRICLWIGLDEGVRGRGVKDDSKSLGLSSEKMGLPSTRIGVTVRRARLGNRVQF